MPLWAGIGSLAGAMVLAAVLIPPLILANDDDGRSDSTQSQVDPSSAPPSVAGQQPEGPAVPTGPERTPSPGAPSGTPRPGGGGHAFPVPEEEPSRTPTSAPTSRNPGPTASASATGGTERFRPLTVQAEAPGNTLGGGAQIATCSACDGGARVRYLGNLTVFFDVPTAGRRTVTVHYTVDGPRELRVAVNDASQHTFAVTGTAWDSPRSVQFDATVPAGRVAVRLWSDKSAPDIDKVTIS
ncbi:MULTISPECIES: hypothetical protein [unclassified Micromonospora]|uniref:hypothetical protein n=1 Tax=unclassified Micromonospora TaxID=2617518 RepID=UPI0015923781|nr:hypothetical protein [Verrucosispora sp. NA02020]QKW14243.1 hypothetical protein HUT12_16615 [Verrucosispora sp. NA02020]